jgi:hypothetical protein
MTMLRKLTLALVAAASLSAVALAPSAASAKPFGGGWGGGWGGGFHHHWGHGFGIGYVGGYDDGGGCYETRRVMTPFGPRLRTINVCGYLSKRASLKQQPRPHTSGRGLVLLSPRWNRRAVP